MGDVGGCRFFLSSPMFYREPGVLNANAHFIIFYKHSMKMLLESLPFLASENGFGPAVSSFFGPIPRLENLQGFALHYVQPREMNKWAPGQMDPSMQSWQRPSKRKLPASWGIPLQAPSLIKRVLPSNHSAVILTFFWEMSAWLSVISDIYIYIYICVCNVKQYADCMCICKHYM